MITKPNGMLHKEVCFILLKLLGSFISCGSLHVFQGLYFCQFSCWQMGYHCRICKKYEHTSQLVYWKHSWHVTVEAIERVHGQIRERMETEGLGERG